MIEYMDISVASVIGLCFVLISYGVEGEASNHRGKNLQSLPADQPYKTAFHFQPPKNWMNDPNGPMYYKGVYHLLYQYNPYGAVWGNIVWGHSISYDLVNWVHLDHAIYPTGPPDINGCWSGSATILPGGEPAILYTGADSNNHQLQNLAVPKNFSDPLLEEWVKSPHNPLITPTEDIDPTLFRDPTTAWQGPDNVWRVVVGSRINGYGTAILYHSNDFIKWIRSQSPLHFSKKTGIWECPDFYPVSINSTYGVDTSAQNEDNKHVLKASFNDSDHYVIGHYVLKTDSYMVETDFMDSGLDMRYDYGKFYASKTFFDSAKSRRILWGWVDESDTESDDIEKGWSGLQSIPRSVLLGKTGKQLELWPIQEIEKLRGKQVNYESRKLKGGSKFEVSDITASQADIEVSFDLPNLDKAELMDSSWVDPQLLCSQKNASIRGKFGPFGLLVLASENLKEQTAIFFRVFRHDDKYNVLMCSDQSRSSLREEVVDRTIYGAFIDIDIRHEEISLRSLIDHSIVESFGGKGLACITARVYPKLAIKKSAHLYVFNSGTQSVRMSKLSAWSMKSAQIVPITKRRKFHIN